MLLNYNWIQSNIENIVNGWDDEFKVHFEPYSFKDMSFQEAAEYTASLINHQYKGNLCVALSGGADSEYVARLLHAMKIPFVPIIIFAPGNRDETYIAEALCVELGLAYYSKYVEEDDIINYYVKNIFEELRNDGLHHTFQMMAADQAREWGKTLILGETHVFDPNPSRSIVRAFKFIPDFRYHDVIPFFYYTLQLAYAEMKEIRPDETTPEFKARVRGTKFRKKSTCKFVSETWETYHDCESKLNPKTLFHDMGTPKDFINQMQEYVR
ncbi:MAG: hypothetical protein ACXV2C_01730 [Candidatus Bathyarchaeia archaeon]